MFDKREERVWERVRGRGKKVREAEERHDQDPISRPYSRERDFKKKEKIHTRARVWKQKKNNNNDNKKEKKR